MKHVIRLDRLLGLLSSAMLLGCGLSSGTERYIPAQYTPQPIKTVTDGTNVALEIAQNWDPGAYLVEVGSIFEYEAGEYQLKHSYYVFVSEDRQQYVSIRVNSVGIIKANPPADVEGSQITATPYFFSENSFHDIQAMNLAWPLLRSSTTDDCEHPKRISVRGGTLYNGDNQVWSLDYIGNDKFLGYLALNAESGEPVVIDINHSICVP